MFRHIQLLSRRRPVSCLAFSDDKFQSVAGTNTVYWSLSFLLVRVRRGHGRRYEGKVLGLHSRFPV